MRSQKVDVDDDADEEAAPMTASAGKDKGAPAPAAGPGRIDGVGFDMMWQYKQKRGKKKRMRKTERVKGAKEGERAKWIELGVEGNRRLSMM